MIGSRIRTSHIALVSALLVVGHGEGTGRLAAQDATQLSAAVRSFVAHDEPTIALVGVRLIDGTGSPPREGQTIVVQDGRISAVGATASTHVPQGAKVLDLKGVTVLPGLVMVHEHLYYPLGRVDGVLHYVSQLESFPRLYLGAGVTTMRTGGALEGYAEIRLARDIAAGRRIGPRVIATAPYIDGPGNPIPQLNAIRSPDDARRMVAYWADEGATWFKVYNYLTRDELAAVVTEAHRRGLHVTGHLCSITATEAVALGIDNLEHGLIQMTDIVPSKQPDVCPGDVAVYAAAAAADIGGSVVREIIQVLVQKGVAVTSTLPIFETIVPGRPPVQSGALSAMSDAARGEYFQSRTRFAEATDSTFTRAFHNEFSFERAFFAAGGLLVAGSDPTGYGGTIAGYGDQRELELLVEAGFTLGQAVQIASLNGARLLGMEAEVGSVAVGKRADLLVLDGDPSTRIQDVRRPILVFKDGVAYDAAKLLSSVRGWVGKY